jgi:hypothetical protein
MFGTKPKDRAKIRALIGPDYLVGGTGIVDDMSPEELRRYCRDIYLTSESDPMCLVADIPMNGGYSVVGTAVGYVLATEVTARRAMVFLEIWGFKKRYGGLREDASREMLTVHFAAAALAEVRKIQKAKGIPAEGDVDIKFLVPESLLDDAIAVGFVPSKRRFVETHLVISG